MTSPGEDWIKRAYGDLTSAKRLAEFKDWNNSSYLAQQSAEKSMKAVLIKGLGYLEKTHSTIKLCQSLENSGLSVPTEVVKASITLDRKDVMFRYPGFEAEEIDALECLNSASVIYEYCSSVINSDATGAMELF